MPHDKGGALIEVGDKVTVEFTVISVTVGSVDGCNVTLETVELMPVANSKSSLTLNSKQIEKLGVKPFNEIKTSIFETKTPLKGK